MYIVILCLIRVSTVSVSLTWMVHERVVKYIVCPVLFQDPHWSIIPISMVQKRDDHAQMFYVCSCSLSSLVYGYASHPLVRQYTISDRTVYILIINYIISRLIIIMSICSVIKMSVTNTYIYITFIALEDIFTFWSSFNLKCINM